MINDIRCKYNQGVICSSWTTKSTAAKCEKCGWRKEVSEQRLVGIRLKRKIQMERVLNVYSVKKDDVGDPVILKNGNWYMSARTVDAAEKIVEMLNADAARTE